nr:hypothetical protein [uncultured Acetatifactor sp.]
MDKGRLKQGFPAAKNDAAPCHQVVDFVLSKYFYQLFRRICCPGRYGYKIRDDPLGFRD